MRHGQNRSGFQKFLKRTIAPAAEDLEELSGRRRLASLILLFWVRATWPAPRGALKVPGTGLIAFLSDIIGVNGRLNANNLVHLYQNNYTPTDNDTLASFTEATFTGYNAKAAANWSAPAIVSLHARTQALPLTWTKNGATGNMIYGYYVTNPGGQLLFAERDPNAPIDMTVDGNSYTLAPQFTCVSEF